MPNQTKWNHLKNDPGGKAIVWVFVIVGWPLLLFTIGDGFRPDVVDLNAFYYAFWLSASFWLILGGWVIITYLCIGKKSSAAVVLIYFAIYVSPLPMYFLASDWDCGPISSWECRWTCKTAQELKNLGAVDDNFSVYDYGGNDIRKVYDAGGLCN